MKSAYERHHFLPEFYQKGFINSDGLLWVYDRTKNEYRAQPPKHTAVSRHAYSFETKDGTKDHNTIEEFFSAIEGNARPAIAKLNNRQPISDDEKLKLATFIAFQKTRVPEFLEENNQIESQLMQKVVRLTFSSEERVSSILKEFEKKTGTKSELSPKEFINFIQSDGYEIKFPRESALMSMLYLGGEIITYLVQMDWIIIWTPDGRSFVTSDSPFYILPPEDHDFDSFYRGVGLITPGARKFFPLTSNACLMMGDHGGTIKGAVANDPRIIRAINFNTAIASDNLLIAPDKSLVKRVVEGTRLPQIKKQPKFRLG